MPCASRVNQRNQKSAAIRNYYELEEQEEKPHTHTHTRVRTHAHTQACTRTHNPHARAANVMLKPSLCQQIGMRTFESISGSSLLVGVFTLVPVGDMGGPGMLDSQAILDVLLVCERFVEMEEGTHRHHMCRMPCCCWSSCVFIFNIIIIILFFFLPHPPLLLLPRRFLFPTQPNSSAQH